MCSGAITLDGDKVTRLVAYYTAAHASKFVSQGSVRIASNCSAQCLPQVAFRTPKGRHILLLSNPEATESSVVVRYRDKLLHGKLPAGAVATYVW